MSSKFGSIVVDSVSHDSTQMPPLVRLSISSLTCRARLLCIDNKCDLARTRNEFKREHMFSFKIFRGCLLWFHQHTSAWLREHDVAEKRREGGRGTKRARKVTVRLWHSEWIANFHPRFTYTKVLFTQARGTLSSRVWNSRTEKRFEWFLPSHSRL